jgi:hypothetical protein
MEHGFTIFRIVCLIFAVLIILGIRYGVIIAPQVRQTAARVVSLNDLGKVDVQCKFHPCGSLECIGNL